MNIFTKVHIQKNQAKLDRAEKLKKQVVLNTRKVL
jgi:hypothetical protein